MTEARVVEARTVEQVVDTDRYPLAEPDGAAWREVVSRTRRELHEVGCSVLPNFIRAAQCDVLQQECAEIAPLAHYDVEVVNVYNIATDSTLPAGHPGRTTMERGNAFVARDRIPERFIIHQLYTSELFRHFIARCFELPRIHELADPLAGLCLNVVSPGMSHPWHFDKNEYTVSMLTQESEGGGIFEYRPNIRSAQAENFEDVQAVLTGQDEHLTRRLSLRPGDLQLFKGRYSLHRVTPVRGETARHSAIFAYSERPGVIGSVARTKQLFGRVLPEHLAAEGHAVRADQLLD
ncbi:HalD/BesD family halogenase [Amycolatopsis nigrescens]|uniref:HalD/BesD family halogenase n=1 Tax=Amycolatopsis nigrescens TaxID=381445 RepID=UPI000590B5A4|nr:ArpA protein [Amycolatopsis nigrescens]